MMARDEQVGSPEGRERGQNGAGGGVASSARGWRQIVDDVVAGSGLELVEAQLLGVGGGRVLRVYVDQPDGVGLGDCERVSRTLSAALDEAATAVEGSYTLEVSSPGLDRRLVKRADYQRFAGQRVRITSRTPIGGGRRHLGILQGADEQGVRIQPETGAEVVFGWENVEQARLAPQWPTPGRRRR